MAMPDCSAVDIRPAQRRCVGALLAGVGLGFLTAFVLLPLLLPKLPLVLAFCLLGWGYRFARAWQYPAGRSSWPVYVTAPHFNDDACV